MVCDVGVAAVLPVCSACSGTPLFLEGGGHGVQAWLVPAERVTPSSALDVQGLTSLAFG